MSKESNFNELSEVFAVFEKFHEVISIIHSTLNIDELKSKASKLIQSHFKTSKHLLLVNDPTKNKFVFICGRGFSEESSAQIITKLLEIKDSFSVLEENCVVKINDCEEVSCVVLKSKKKLIGVFVSVDPLIESLNYTDREFLQILALSVLYTYTNATIYEMTKKLAIWDNKTKLYNYRYFLQRLSNEVARARRYGRKLSVIAFDIDNFKEVNNRLGHLAADRILLDLASLVKTSIRVVDIPSRFGGDEFFILLPETDISGAEVVAERLKNLIESQLFPLNQTKNRIKLTISYGIAELKDNMTAREIMNAADNSLMENKKAKKGVKVGN
jgi:diguanylate cyclase (GGDEF)-like protein